MKTTLLKSIFTGMLLFSSAMSSVANAGLIDRGNGFIYDDVLDITWLQDANYAQTSGYDSDGKMTWQESVDWAEQLSFGGYNDWRLTHVYDQNNDGCIVSANQGTDCGYNVDTSFTDVNGNTHFSELAHMFYENLNNIAYRDENGKLKPAGWKNLNKSFTDALTGKSVAFDNLMRVSYWSGTKYMPDIDSQRAWDFDNQYGKQSSNVTFYSDYAWAVRDGDVGAVDIPEPTTLTIFMLGVLVLAFRSHKNKK
jgi:hypothetical protein